MKKKAKKITINNILILAKLTDGTVRQVVAEEWLRQKILDIIAISMPNNTIKIDEKILEVIDFPDGNLK